MIVLPLTLGALVVFQSVMNRTIGETRGLSFAVTLNAGVLLAVALAVLGVLAMSGNTAPAYLRPQWNGDWRWWYVLPGIFGFTLVAGMPLAMRGLGAFPSIVALILGQLLCSLIWDAISQGQGINLARISGLILTIAGAYLAFKPVN